MDNKYGVLQKQIKASEMFGKSTINEYQRQEKKEVVFILCRRLFAPKPLFLLMISELVAIQIS